MDRPASTAPARRRAAGFTIVEVLVVVVIVGILLSVALPGYQENIRKGRRSDAKSALMDAANRQERHMLDRSTYTLDMTELGFDADPMISEEGYYSIDAAACATGTIRNCYVLTATPVAGGAQADDSNCVNFVLDSTAARQATGATADECW